MPHGNWLEQFEDKGLKVMIPGLKFGYLIFPYEFKDKSVTIGIAPITVNPDTKKMTWRSRRGPITSSGKKMFILDLITVPTSAVTMFLKTVAEMANRIGGPEVQQEKMEHAIDIKKAEANEDELKKRLKILGLT